jgi:outer membrane protein assembly factor BamE
MLTVSACSIYKMEIQQGNALSNETVSQLKPGMSKNEVATLLGNPLLHDAFHKDRWDYVYYTNKKGEENLRKNLTLIFQNGLLVQVK